MVKELILNWVTKLPVTVQNQLQPHIKDLCDPSPEQTGGSIQNYIELVIRHIKTEPERVIVPRYPCGWCSEDLVVTCNCHTAKRLKMTTSSRQEDFTKAGGEQRQRVLPRKEARPVSRLPDEEFEECRRKGLCFACKETWNPGHKCAGKPKPRVNMAMVPEVVTIEDRNEEYLDSILDAAILGATMALTGHDSVESAVGALRVTATLKLNGISCKGLHLDTLSDYSYVISPFLTKLYGSEGWKEDLREEQPMHRVACGNHGALSILGAIDVEVQGDYGPPLKHTFYVLPSFPSNIYCIVGTDLMDKLGVHLTNVPTGKGESLLALAVEYSLVGEPVQTGQDLGYSLTLCSEELKKLSSNKKDQAYIDYLYTYRLRLEEAATPLFKENEAIKGFCSHPQAEIRFETSDDLPVRSHPYRIPDTLKEHVDTYFQELLDRGVIEPEKELDHSLLSILVVPKRDIKGAIKDWRPCLDPRKINVKIADPIYPLPLASDIFKRLQGKKIFSILDLKSGFNQMLVRKKDRKKTAFMWKGRVYHYVGAPFGFKNIPQDFQQIMDVIFADMPFVLVYIDDLIIASDSYEQHRIHVLEVIRRLNSVNLRANRKKCLLAYDKLVVLGNLISEEGQQVARDKLLRMDKYLAEPSESEDAAESARVSELF